MSKGSKRRPAAIPSSQFADAWDRTFRSPIIQAMREEVRLEQESRALTGEAPDAVDAEREAWMTAQEDRALREALAEQSPEVPDAE